MIIVDGALRARAESSNPIKVGLIGAGSLGASLASQIIDHVPGMRLAAIANRHVDKAVQAFARSNVADIVTADSITQVEDAILHDRPLATSDADLVCRAEGIDVVVEATGTIEFGAGMAVQAIEHGKHVILVNAELDGTVGPILKLQADRAGVILSGCDGDQPGAEMNLFRFARAIGMEPLLCGNIKGLEDHYRTPTTQESFARRWQQQPYMATSFADGTKISFEQAVVANATGMGVAKRGMLGYQHDGHVDDLTKLYDLDQLREWGGIVDYVIGARPAPGVFILGALVDPKKSWYLEMYKMGQGPLYCLYTPYHLCQFEMPFSIARAALFRDATIAPTSHRVDVVATAKRELHEDDVLDGYGHYMTYGQCENADVAREQRLLPIGVVEGCRLRRAVPRDQTLTYDDVVLPPGRVCDRLRAEQEAYFALQTVRA